MKKMFVHCPDKAIILLLIIRIVGFGIKLNTTPAVFKLLPLMGFQKYVRKKRKS